MTSHFDSSIKLWQFKRDEYSENFRELEGHTSQVLGLEHIRESPLLVTSDELGVIKTWDIRTLKCKQTYITDSQIIFSQFLSIPKHDLMVGIESRMAWFVFEEHKEKSDYFIVNIGFDSKHSEIFIATNLDLRLIDSLTGKTA